MALVTIDISISKGCLMAAFCGFCGFCWGCIRWLVTPFRLISFSVLMVNKKLFKIYLHHSFALFTTIFSSNTRYIASTIRLILEEKIVTK